MISAQQRQNIYNLIAQAQQAGARLSAACKVIGISPRTLQRWKPHKQGPIQQDKRPTASRPEPRHKLTIEERKVILDICNSPEYASLPPTQIVPKLADQGIFLASASSMYRILIAHNQLHHRGYAKAPQGTKAPQTHRAEQPNELWSWDITYLPTRVQGKFFYLYAVIDIYSRYTIIWEVYERESGELAAELIEKAVWREGLAPHQRPILHNDNGSVMKSFTFKAKLESLGIAQSFSRPRVSDDNAFVESFFRTLKYTPKWPAQGFETLAEARGWVQSFMQWYNFEHQHSKIQFVTPAQRHHHKDAEILAKRQALYQQAKAKNPRRWSGKTRDWSPVGAVTLNPTKVD